MPVYDDNGVRAGLQSGAGSMPCVACPQQRGQSILRFVEAGLLTCPIAVIKIGAKKLSSEQIKKLERKVKYLLDTKEIPSPMMDAVRSLMKNQSLHREERAKAIIRNIEKCEDRKPVFIEETKNVSKLETVKQVGQIEKKSKSKIVDRKKSKSNKIFFSNKNNKNNENDYSPTQTSYYINGLYKNYKKYKLFKKKYLVKEGDRISFEINKRLVPSKKLLKLLKQIFVLQRECASKLLLGMNNLLEDPTVENPLLFNYLKILRSWLSIEPLSYRNSSDIPWLGSYVFDKEFSEWISGYYSMQEITPEDREFIFKGLLLRLQNIIEYKKDIINNNDNGYVKSEKERRNNEIDKKLFEIKSNLRSFLHGKDEEGTWLSSMIKMEYDISGLRELTSIILNALIYQRFVKEEEFYKRYSITAPTVSREHWDYSKDILKNFGKDDEALKQKRLEIFEKKFESLELVYKFLKLKQLGNSYVFEGASLQLKHIDKNRNMPNLIFDSDSLYYIDCILKYFKNVFFQIIDGSIIGVKDNKNNYRNTNIFELDLFSDICSQLEGAINKLSKFKSENTTQNINKTELQKIFEGQITTMDNFKAIVKDIGMLFYNAASRFKKLYDIHSEYFECLKGSYTEQHFRMDELKPIPFYDCVIESLPVKNSLSDQILGKMFVGSGYSEGVFGNMMIYCYQAAQFCSNDRLKNDLYERETLMTLIKQLKI
jgi:hypothetical protein